jgi:hypothetical protein
MARPTPPNGPKAHSTKWTLISSLTVDGVPGRERSRLRRFDIKAEAEEALKKAQARGEQAFIQPPLAAWAGKY